MKTVEECEETLERWISECSLKKRLAEETILSHAHMVGVIRALVHQDKPPEEIVLEVKNFLSAFDRLRGKRAADRDPQPAA